MIFDMNIKECYLKLIKAGIKQHEYRLAKEKYRNIKIGDFIKLISDDNKNNYILVRVKNINHFNNWYDALKNTWEDDFKGQYSNINDLINEFMSFYTQEDIKKFGICVYSIEYLNM